MSSDDDKYANELPLKRFAYGLVHHSENEIFPDTIEGFGYKFEDGKLRNTETGDSFVFDETGIPQYNQKRYEVLGELITQYVYDLLLTEGKLIKKYIPVDAIEGEARSFIFHSEDAFSNPLLMVLIHGSGVVRAGQWSRRLIINDCLDSGSQLPFIKQAQDLNYGVIVLNTNENYFHIDKKRIPIRGSRSPEIHACYVWRHIISKTKARQIAIIAHSYGGVVTVQLCKDFFDDFKDRVFAIAFTDSVHSLNMQSASSSVSAYLRQITRNWVSSQLPLDSPVTRCSRDEIECVSAGVEKHEETTWSSFSSIFQFIEEQLRQRTKDEL